VLAQMSGMMGGHCAERLVLGDVSTGSTSDLKRATQIARSMVTEYGMSEKLGPIFLGGDHEVFLGRDFSQSRSTFSEDVNAQIDSEVRRLLDSSYERALIILKAHRGVLDRLADTLIQREKIDREEFLKIVGVKPDEDAGSADIAPEAAPAF
jgi:cell division protease FtsH